jgi:AICAR transformylase/IMP cyclohydrolase PurH
MSVPFMKLICLILCSKLLISTLMMASLVNCSDTIVSTGGTASALESAGVSVTKVHGTAYLFSGNDEHLSELNF